jgi:UDPglucose--hexose-1-phosphate uridylyltransferase
VKELRRDPLTARWVLVGEWPDPRPQSVALEGEAIAVTDAPNAVFDRRIPVDRDRGTIHEKMTAAGQHEVLLEHAEPGTSMSSYPVERIAEVLIAWRERMKAFADDKRWRQLAVVKSHGALAGARYVQPASEIFALPFVPQTVREKMVALGGYHRKTGSCLLCDLIRGERIERVRFVVESVRHAAMVPYAARSPFEVMLLPKGHHGALSIETDEELSDLADLLRRVLLAIEEVLDRPAYRMTLWTSPLDAGADLSEFHWHLEVRPLLPLAGALGELLDFNPVPPEQAAEALREALAKNP